MFTQINIEGCNLLKDEDTNDKVFIKSNLRSIAINGDINCNGVNNLLAMAATVLSILCSDRNAVKKLESKFTSQKLVDLPNIESYKDYIANVECCANSIITNAIDWFKSEYSSLLNKVSQCNINEDSKIKIVTEMDNALSRIISYIAVVDDNTIYTLGFNIHSIKEVEKYPDAISFTNKKLIEICKEVSKELTELILGNDIPQVQQPVVQQPVIPEQHQPENDGNPQINIEIEPDVTIDILEGNTTPTINIPKGYSANSGEELAIPFINYNMAYCVPCYNDEDINKHFIINDIVNIPDENVQREFGILLKNIAKALDEKDKLLGFTEPSKFIFTSFYTNKYWIAERLRNDDSLYISDDKYYISLTMIDGNLSWYGPSK